MKLVYTEKSVNDEKWIENISVEKDGERKSSVTERLTIQGWMQHYSDEESVDSEIFCCGGFVFVNRRCKESYFDGLLLCFYEPNNKLRNPSVYDKSRNFWPYARVQYSITNPLLTCGPAVYFSSNPAKSDLRLMGYQPKKIIWKDQRSAGRWLLPHPDGSRAAYDRMFHTTLEDDWVALLPYLHLEPKAIETFSEL